MQKQYQIKKHLHLKKFENKIVEIESLSPLDFRRDYKQYFEGKRFEVVRNGQKGNIFRFQFASLEDFKDYLNGTKRNQSNYPNRFYMQFDEENPLTIKF